MFRRTTRQLSILSIALLLLQLLPWGGGWFGDALATQTQRIWDGGGAPDGKWSTAANWSGDTAAIAGDTCTFDATSAAKCTLTTNINVGRLVTTAAYSGIISFGATTDTFTKGVSVAGTDSVYLKTAIIEMAGGSWITSGSVVCGTSDLQFTGTGFQYMKGTSLYYDVSINKASGNWVDSSGLRTATGGDFTVTDAGTSVRHVASPVFGGDALYNGSDTVFGPTTGSWTMNGPSSTLHMQSTGVRSNVSGDSLIFNGTTGCTFDNDLAGTFLMWVHGNAALVTISGAATSVFVAPTTPLVFLGTGTLTNNNTTDFRVTTSGGAFWSGTPTIAGTAATRFRVLAAGNINAPTITNTGSGGMSFDGASGVVSSVTQTGNLSCVGPLNIYTGSITSTDKTFTFNTAGYNIVTSALTYGCGRATATNTTNFNKGSSVDVNGAVNATTQNLGTITITDSAAWSDSGNVTALSAATYNVATSKHTLIGPASTITSNGKQFADTIVVNPSEGKRVTLADNLLAGVLRHIGGVLAFGGHNITTSGRFVSTSAADSCLARIATCTLTTGTAAQDTMSAGWVQLDSAVWRVSGATGINYSSASTPTLRKLSQTNATDRTTLNGSGSWTWLTAPWLGDLTVAKSGGTITVGTLRVDSLAVTGGALAITNHSGADSVRMALSHTGGTLNASGDTVYLGGPATWGAGATHTTDAATLYRIADGATITTAGKAMPCINALGSIAINGGGTIRRLTVASTTRDTATFGPGTYAFTGLDSSDLNGQSGAVLLYRGGTWDLPAPGRIVVNYLEAANCTTSTGDTIDARAATNVQGAGTVGWLWPILCTPPTITRAAMRTDTVYRALSFTHVLGGGTADSVVAITTLPAGLTMTTVGAGMGTISGTPTAATAKAGYAVRAYGCLDSSTAWDTLTIVNRATTLAPSKGDSSGGTPVLIRGSGFKPTRSTGLVRFGADTARAIVSWCDTAVACSTAHHAPGFVNVALKNSSGDSTVVTNGFRFTVVRRGGGHLGFGHRFGF